MMRLRNLSHSYGDEAVVDDVSLSIDQGEVVGVIGPSGVGKTTLLRLLSLFLEPDAGTVELDGDAVWEADEDERLALRRQVGMVFQDASLFDATVARNVEYGLRVRQPWRERLRDQLRSLVAARRLPGPVGRGLDAVGLRDPLQARVRSLVGTTEPPEAVTDALGVVGLDHKLDQQARSLSGGEAQRVSFARALAYEPDYLLLDEPTSDLDPRNTGLIEAAIGEARDRGIGVVVATHDMHQAERIADRVGVLLGDGFTEIGPTERIFEDPSDERTRKFISGELVY
ncbi:MULTISPECIES: ATP-binding cassette domain-containing protein [Halolamina]|uniref:Tungstate transport system ATP-binding protein n=1 Tax=Halolamina pelagica TaxID=699431 RepID=A0A1I5SZ24_9EURY|nr:MULTISPECIES: phosphate ABC transporter ATP-binding protein [Halolamina]NHX36921.1 phosphate ABC transporter ATP-binding protein [Halolamina sp. R1-12]SFP75881.1 tungstate transport system ATP-binding protein [Halolamina pelagica]